MIGQYGSKEFPMPLEDVKNYVKPGKYVWLRNIYFANWCDTAGLSRLFHLRIVSVSEDGIQIDAIGQYLNLSYYVYGHTWCIYRTKKDGGKEE